MIKISRALAALGLVCAVGGANASLVGRDINGNAVIQRDSNGVLDASAVFLYDDVLNVTWLRSASANGRMNWWAANTWATNLTVGNYTGWRLPSMIDTGAVGCSGFGYSGTDCGYNVQTKSGDPTQYQAGQTVYSELASLFYDTLGNKAKRDTTGAMQSGWGLANSGDFPDLWQGVFWTGLVLARNGNFAWEFNTRDGEQGYTFANDPWQAMAVRDGDVLATPIPAAAWLMLSGIGALGAVVRHRQSGKAAVF